MALYIHQGNFYLRNGKPYYLNEVSHIFTCPAVRCEYVMTGRTEDEAVTLRNTHMRICHKIEHKDLLWKESFETEVPDYVKRVLDG